MQIIQGISVAVHNPELATTYAPASIVRVATGSRLSRIYNQGIDERTDLP